VPAFGARPAPMGRQGALWSIKGIANHRYLIQRWLTFHGIQLNINEVGHFEGFSGFSMMLAFTSDVMK
jgi:hypothetical protein